MIWLLVVDSVSGLARPLETYKNSHTILVKYIIICPSDRYQMHFYSDIQLLSPNPISSLQSYGILTVCKHRCIHFIFFKTITVVTAPRFALVIKRRKKCTRRKVMFPAKNMCLLLHEKVSS